MERPHDHSSSIFNPGMGFELTPFSFGNSDFELGGVAVAAHDDLGGEGAGQTLRATGGVAAALVESPDNFV